MSSTRTSSRAPGAASGCTAGDAPGSRAGPASPDSPAAPCGALAGSSPTSAIRIVCACRRPADSGTTPIPTPAPSAWNVANALTVTRILLVPVFAVLVGLTTRERAQTQWRALETLSGHFLDVVCGLPTLVAYGRAERQTATIAEVSQRHRRATMRTLRLAFMSAAALELLATISVAIVAVLVGQLEQEAREPHRHVEQGHALAHARRLAHAGAEQLQQPHPVDGAAGTGEKVEAAREQREGQIGQNLALGSVAQAHIVEMDDFPVGDHARISVLRLVRTGDVSGYSEH